jgi:rieske iron-sulfur protein
MEDSRGVPDRHPAMMPGRRAVLKGAISATVGLTILPVASLAQDDPATRRPQPGDLLVRTGDTASVPLTAKDVPAGPPIMAWPMDPMERIVRSGSRFNQVLLVKLDAAKLSAETQGRAAEGIVAYTTICTHSGCDVSDWLAGDQLLHCACHATTFDPKDGAKVVEGPAPRSLPALPLAIADGTLVVSGGFTDKVGFDAA